MNNTGTPNRENGRAGVGRPYRVVSAALVRPWLLLGTLLLALAGRAQAQVTLENSSVRANAEVRNAPPQIKLRWTPDPTATRYQIYRKDKDAVAWGASIADVSTGTATLGEYADNTVAVGTVYEYYIRKTAGTVGAGYVLAGIAVPAVEQRGTVVLLVEATHANYLAADLAQLESDLVGDGWQVIRHDVAAALPPPQVRAIVQADYQANPTQVKAVFILGHVAVPYSGRINVDGHTDHIGAWPADVYYGEMTNTWSDNQVNEVSAARPENRNVPGDGKFDQSSVPNMLQLAVGRVDLSNLPAFALSERDLLRRYLLKDHQFRHRQFVAAERGLIDDQFGVYGTETFANNGWRNFSALFGPTSGITESSYFGTLRTADYLWAYTCGPGYYTGIGNVGSTADLAGGPMKSVFNMQFGSYFGDWDNADNFLRATLAADGYTLTNCWAGRPNWCFHQMGMGETIGYCTRKSQAAASLYSFATGSAGTHVSLLGDPTLRLHMLAPAAALTATLAAGQAVLSWTASPEAVLGYYVYRAPQPGGPFTRITAQPVTATSFTDAAPLYDISTYMVRAVQLKEGASGSYYNLSQGVFSSPLTNVPNPNDGIWRGTLSTNWNTPANWNNGWVPTSIGSATIPAGTPFAPVVGSTAAVGLLVLEPQAQLTVAPGATLTVRDDPQMQSAPAGGPSTSLVLAAGTATAPGGQLQVLSHTTAASGLTLGPNTALTVGNYAELRLLGSFQVSGGTTSFAPLGRLTFAHDPALPTPVLQHTFAGTAPVPVGILAVDDAAETLALNTPLEVLNRVENQGTIISNGNLTLRAALGQQAILVPMVPAPGQPRTLGTYTGYVRVQVYVDGSRNAGPGYRHLAAPVWLATVNDLGNSAFAPVINPLFNQTGNTVVPFPNVFRYDQNRIATTQAPPPIGFEQGWASPLSLSDYLTYGRGYTVNMPANTTLSFTGEPVTTVSAVRSPFSVMLPRGLNAAAGWHLLGNPFVAPLDWDQLIANRHLRNASNALYVFKSSGQYAGSYASYVPGTGGSPGIGLNGGTNVLPVGQGFFVRVNSQDPTQPPTANLVFHLDDLLTTPEAPNVQRSTSDTRPRLTLALRNTTATVAHQTAIYFQAGATAGPDGDFDAPYFPGSGQGLTLTSGSGGTLFSINGLPELTGGDVAVPLQLSAAATGSYELAVETLANLPAGYHAYLTDAATGTYTDLAATPTIAVALAAGAPIVGRYGVLFSRQLRVLATAPAVLAALVSLYPNPAHGQAMLTMPHTLREPQATQVTVLNSIGQMVAKYHWPAGSETLILPLIGLPAGLYTVQVGTTVGTVSRRLVVE